jgi:CDP-glycerol glycerophosphotransferase (TagB/SpsB family)
MVAADVLVTDHSSVGFEFMLLDRPLVVVDCPTLIEKARVNRDKVRLLRSAADVVGDADGVASTAIRALANPSRFGSERRTIAADLFYGAGSATARALTCIYDLLDLPAHYVEPRTAKAAPVT